MALKLATPMERRMPLGFSGVMARDSRACQVSWMGTGTCSVTFFCSASDQKLLWVKCGIFY